MPAFPDELVQGQEGTAGIGISQTETSSSRVDCKEVRWTMGK